MIDGIQEVLERTQASPVRRPVAEGIRRGTGPLLVEQPQRLKLLEIKHAFGQFAPSIRDLLETAAKIADSTTFPAEAGVNDRVLRLFLSRAASQLIAPLQQAATQAERERDVILYQAPSQEQHDALDAADRQLYDARSCVYVARQQVDQLIEDAIDDLEGLLIGITIGDLAGLFRLAAADLAAHTAASHVRRPAMTS